MIQRVPLAESSGAIQALERDGAVIVTGFADQKQVEQVNEDSAAVIQKTFNERESAGEALGTARCTHLYGYSYTAREIWMQQPDLQQIITHFLTTTNQNYNDDTYLTTQPLLSAAATMCIGPGGPAQTLHRDDFLWQKVHEESLEGKAYKPGRDLGIGILVPGCKTVKENGATVLVPGSHLWSHEKRPNPEEVNYGEMEVGEALLFLSSTVHGGGANVSKDFRRVHGFFFCRSWLKPEENQHVYWTKEEIKTWSTAAQKQAGYILENPFIGHCNEGNPIDHFRASGIEAK